MTYASNQAVQAALVACCWTRGQKCRYCKTHKVTTSPLPARAGIATVCKYVPLQYHTDPGNSTQVVACCPMHHTRHSSTGVLNTLKRPSSTTCIHTSHAEQHCHLPLPSHAHLHLLTHIHIPPAHTQLQHAIDGTPRQYSVNNYIITSSLLPLMWAQAPLTTTSVPCTSRTLRPCTNHGSTTPVRRCAGASNTASTSAGTSTTSDTKSPEL